MNNANSHIWVDYLSPEGELEGSDSLNEAWDLPPFAWSPRDPEGFVSELDWSEVPNESVASRYAVVTDDEPGFVATVLVQSIGRWIRNAK